MSDEIHRALRDISSSVGELTGDLRSLKEDYTDGRNAAQEKARQDTQFQNQVRSDFVQVKDSLSNKMDKREFSFLCKLQQMVSLWPLWITVLLIMSALGLIELKTGFLGFIKQ
jgi:hypothetical protein